MDPFRTVEGGTFKGRIYFRPRNGGCYASVMARNKDRIIGTGDLVHPGCKSGKWGWWEITWIDKGKDGRFDATVDFIKAQYRVSLIHSVGKEWELCM